jgi:hypothetical protein
LLIAGFIVLAAVVVFSLPRIPQDRSYHNFADRRTMLRIPNFMNVVSNLPFALAGILGILNSLRRQKRTFLQGWERWGWASLFAAVSLISIGSSYYHLAPDNETLFWDRLPMTAGFMSLFALVIAERVSMQTGRALLLPLIAVGVGSVLWWRYTEAAGSGDLRPYLLVQYLPMLAIPAMLLGFPAKYTRVGDLLLALGLYACAKVFEGFDGQILALGGIISGHTVKHLTAGLATIKLANMAKTQRPVVFPHPDFGAG